MRDTDIQHSCEIYIPEDAEVKMTPFRTFPTSIKKSLEHHKTKGEYSRLATWISPVLIRDGCCSPASSSEKTAKNKLSSIVTRESTSVQDPFLIPFVSSSYTAFKVLEDFSHTMQNIPQVARTPIPSLPHGPLPFPLQDVIIILHGKIFLSIDVAKTLREKKHCSDDLKESYPRDPPQTETCSLSPACKRQKKSSPTSLKPSRKQPQINKELLDRFHLSHEVQVILPRIPPEDIHSQASEQCSSANKDHKTKQNHVITRVLNANQLSKGTSGRRHEEHMEFMTQNTTLNEPPNPDLCSSKFSTGRCGGIICEADDEQEPDEEGGHNDMNRQVGATDYDPGHHNEMEGSIIIPTLTSTQRQYHGFDFEQSAREERINCIKAKLREKEAALNNLHSPS
ncbi:hypothetical protein UPYG_G00011070 [Umbra pygmaea]|uniref:Uncharacterized protein n=1 Tax=Umbra pygmaea TaxID=75934 RepID=A0ABD0XXE9_UMBPY